MLVASSTPYRPGKLKLRSSIQPHTGAAYIANLFKVFRSVSWILPCSYVDCLLKTRVDQLTVCYWEKAGLNYGWLCWTLAAGIVVLLFVHGSAKRALLYHRLQSAVTIGPSACLWSMLTSATDAFTIEVWWNFEDANHIQSDNRKFRSRPLMERKVRYCTGDRRICLKNHGAGCCLG